MNIWKGIIENNVDEKKLGRVQIRIFGKHTENKSDDTQDSYLTTEDLPWAIPAFGIGSANISGQCQFAIPEKGSMVYGFFEDTDEQNAVYFATVPKIVTERPDFSQGFTDPDKINPIAAMDGESQISRLARNEKIEETIIQSKRDNVIVGVDAGNGVTFDEPATEYNTVYPNNKVIESKSGHIIELDDSEGVERIHIYHKSESSLEFFPNGDKVEKTNGSIFKITAGDTNIVINGNNNIHIGVNQNKKIVGNKSLEVDGTERKIITGAVTKETGAITKTVNGENNETVNGGNTENITGANNITVGGDDSETITGSKTVKSPNITIDGVQVQITGGTLTVNGAVTAGAGPFCLLQTCLFTGAPHQGNIVTGT